MKKLFAKILAIIVVLSITLYLAGCGQSQNSEGALGGQKTTIKIAYLPITHSLPLHVEAALPKDKDKAKNFDLELVKYGSWPELMDALNSGRIDGASVLAELGIKAKEQGIDLKAVALGHRDGNVVVAANDINSPKDFKGKTFAIPHRLSSHNILLYMMLKNAGLSLNDVNVVELPPPEMPAALFEGRVAGYCVAEPFGAKTVVSDKGKVLFKSEELWKDSICCALVLRNDFIKKNRVASQELVNEYVKAGEYITSHGAETKEIAKKYMNVEPNVLDLSLKWISYNNLKIQENDFDYLIKYLKELNLVKNPPSYTDFVDNSLIDKVK